MDRRLELNLCQIGEVMTKLMTKLTDSINSLIMTKLLIIILSITNVSAQDLDFSLIGETSRAWQRPVNDVKEMKYGPSPADAMAYAVADISKLQTSDQPFQRYVWIPDGDKQKIAIMNYTINLAISKASVLIKPTIVADGRLMRWDLRSLAPKDDQYAILHALWEELAFEPYFHIVKTTAEALPTNAIQVKSLLEDPPGSIRFKIGDQLLYKSPSNEFFVFQDNNWQIKQLSIETQRVVSYGAHVGLEQGVILQGLSQSNAAVVRYDFLLVKVLSSIDGGMYYRFAGIERNPSSGTAQDAFLQSLGASTKLVEELRSDQRAAMFRSGVTGKPRRIDAFFGVGVRPGSGTGLITMTHDMSDNDVNPRSDPIRNLLNLNDQAREIIAEKPNGLHIFALFDGKGALQDEVPPNIAKDHTVPIPHTARLQVPISCIRCHGPDEGLKSFKNEVQMMLAGSLDVFGDVSSNEQIPDQLDRLAGLYAGDLNKPLRRARDDYNDAVFRVTNGMNVTQISTLVSDVYSDYIYKEIGAFEVCYELGYLVPKDEAIYYLNKIIPPLPNDIIGISPEDPIIGALKAGLKVNRLQFEQVYPDLAFRALQTRKNQK